MIREFAAVVGVPAGTRGYLLTAAAYAVAEGAAIGLLLPLLTALVSGSTGTAGWWLIPLAAVVLAGWLLQFRIELTSLGLAARWRERLYERVGRQLVRVPVGYFDADRSGSVPRLIASDIAGTASIVYLAPRLISAVVAPVVIGASLVAFQPWIALAAIVCAPVVGVVVVVTTRLIDRSEKRHDAIAAEASARLVEFGRTQELLRATGRSDSGRRALDRALRAEHRAARRMVLGALPGQYLGQLSIQLGFTAVLVVGVVVATGKATDAAGVVAGIVAGISLLRPVSVIAGGVAALRSVHSSVGRIRELLAVPPLPEASAPQSLALADGKGPDVRFEQVDFCYASGPAVLQQFSLVCPAGRTTAMIGSSGAGKTTVTKLVARFYDVDAGTVRIGGVDVRAMATAELRDTVAMVFQNVQLLDAGIADNIRSGRPDADDERVREAARRAQVLPIVDRLPGGWDAPVGEGGRLLSGGERQRVAIARALCTDAPVVVLDEATSSLDAENEALVTDALRELAIGRTLIVVAHQLSTIVDADTIAVLEAGRVVEQGTHTELLRRRGRYAEFWHERSRAAGWRLA